MEFRIKDVDLQYQDENSLKIGGYINVTERESEMLYSKRNRKWFKEIMKKGVFQRAINNSREIPLLFEHDWEKRLASTTDCSLTLKEDNIGLRFDAVITDESVYEKVKTGVINACSFGFRVLAEEVKSVNARLERRFVSDIELLEVSLVGNPAYVGSLAETRAYEEERKCDSDDEKRVEEEEKQESAEVTVDETEDKTDSKEEDSKEEDSKEEDSKEEDSNKRFSDVVEVNPDVEVNDNGQVLEEAKEVIQELIDQKEEEIAVVENAEDNIQQKLEIVKIQNDIHEKELQNISMKANAQIIKLRLELIKLKTIKDGI